MKKETLYDASTSSDFMLVINSFPEDKEDDLLYVDIGVVRRKGWFGKLCFVFTYLFQNSDNTPYFIEVLLDRNEQQKLVTIVQNNLDLSQP